MKAIFPGSFDPFTVGHEDVVLRAAKLFEKVYVAVGVNSNKKYRFPLEKRIEWINNTFKDIGNVEVIQYTGLTSDLCKKLNANCIVRGIRNSQDMEYESPIAFMNNQMNNDVETIYLVTNPKYQYISSTILREIYNHKQDISPYLPKNCGFDL